MLQARRWELDSVPELGDRPQAIINRQIVDGADLLIAVFSARLGTSTGVSASGTAEEIERLRSMDKPALVYFSKAPLPRDHDPDQLKRLNEYKRELRAKGLYCEFESDEDLRRQVSRHLAGTISTLSKDAQNQKPGKQNTIGKRITSNRAERQKRRCADGYYFCGTGKPFTGAANCGICCNYVCPARLSDAFIGVFHSRNSRG